MSATIIIVYGDIDKQANDPWLVDVHDPLSLTDPDAELPLHKNAHELLIHNDNLRTRLHRDSSGFALTSHVTCQPAAHNSIYVGDYAMQNLHLLMRLVEYCRKLNSRWRVIFVPSSAVDARLRGVDQAITSDTRDECPLTTLMAEGPSATNIDYAFSKTWPESDPEFPTRVVYIQTLMWFRKLSKADCEARIANLLQGAILHPPIAVNDACDDKKRTADVFGKYMLPQQWVSVANQTVKELCATLLIFMDNHVGNLFVVKGSTSTCGYSYHGEIKRHDVRELNKAVSELVNDLHQHCIGIQVFSSHLRRREYRCFVVARPLEAPTAYRIGVTVETRPPAARGKEMHISTSNYVEDGNCACGDLVETILKDDDPAIAEFWNRLLMLRIPVLRIDSFYDADHKRSMLNEFAPAPDAVVFTATHEAPVVSIVGRAMAEQMIDACKRHAAQ